MAFKLKDVYNNTWYRIILDVKLTEALGQEDQFNSFVSVKFSNAQNMHSACDSAIIRTRTQMIEKGYSAVQSRYAHIKVETVDIINVDDIAWESERSFVYYN